MRYAVDKEWCKLVGHQMLSMPKAVHDMSSLKSVSSSDVLIGTTAFSILIWNVSSCLLLNEIPITQSQIPLTLVCLSAIRQEEIIYLSLIHLAATQASGCALVALDIPAGICTQLVDYIPPSDSWRFHGVGSDTGQNIIAIFDSNGLIVWNKLTGQCIGTFQHEAKITSCCSTDEILVLGLADGNVHILSLEDGDMNMNQ
jgi:hypothetical protein